MTTENQRIAIYLLIWAVVFFGLPYVLSGGLMDEYLILRSLAIFSATIVFVIINIKVLFPRFYLNNKYRWYIASTVSMLIIISIFVAGAQQVFLDRDMMPVRVRDQNLEVPFMFVGSFFPMMIVFLSTTIFEISIYANRSAKETAVLKSEKLESELKFLKSQINPHFLFNSLNNIYVLTMINPTSAGESVLKLSEMLRYLLYECDAEKVPLEKEMKYLKNYMDLFALKDEEPLNVVFDNDAVEGTTMVAPLLFIPFVENAFKHSQIEDIENGWIKIKLQNTDNEVHFEVHNSLPKTEFSKDDVGGIGLQNVKRQLELIYPNKHTLDIQKLEDSFQVKLVLRS